MPGGAAPRYQVLCVWISWALGECSVTLSVQGGGRPFGRGNGSDGKLAKVYAVLMSPIFKTDLPAQTGINRKILVGDFARLFGVVIKCELRALLSCLADR